MQTIETGYKPEFGLGAYFAGQNAANAEDLNQEELIKAYLANRQSAQMNPLLVDEKQQSVDQSRIMNPLEVFAKQNTNRVGEYDAAYADKKRLDPDYMDANLRGQIGQMQTQEAAGKTANALQPFRQRAEQSQLESEAGKQDVLWTMQDIDKQLAAGGGTDASGNVVPFTPMQKMFMENKRAELTDQLKSTPEFAGKKELSDDKIEAQLEAQRIRMQGQLDAAEQKAIQTSAKALSDKQLYAKAYQIISGLVPSTPQEKLAAQAILDGMQADAVGKNAALSNPSIDLGELSKGKVPMTTPVAQVARDKANASAAAVNVAVPQTQDAWNDAWSKLGKGQSMTGLDGKTYTKK